MGHGDGLLGKSASCPVRDRGGEDWGLDPAAFELPPADALPRTPEEQAIAEIKLDLTILKYARFAKGGRLNPPEVRGLFDQGPSLRDPKIVLAEVEAAEAPDAYLQSLHPKHEQFQRLRKALLEARGKSEEGPCLLIPRACRHRRARRGCQKD